MNGGGMNGGGMNGGGGGMNGGGAMNGMGGSIQQEEGLNDEVDKTINKLKTNIQKQKTLNNLKHELKKSNDDPSYSIVDKYARSKKDVNKLFLMALLILLGLSMNDIVKFYLSKYIMNNDLTNNNEIYLRLSIPLSVLLLIWTMKALSK
jgi:hypothetical protein